MSTVYMVRNTTVVRAHWPPPLRVGTEGQKELDILREKHALLRPVRNAHFAHHDPQGLGTVHVKSVGRPWHCYLSLLLLPPS